MLIEDGYFGLFWRFRRGFEWRAGARTALTATFDQGGHDGSNYGPNLLLFGIERRFAAR